MIIAIVTALAAILLPALGAARSSARRLVCQTQLREYGRGLSYYIAEYDDTFPAADYGPVGKHVREPTWYQLVGSYLAVGEEYGEAIPHSQLGRPNDGTGLARCPELRGGHENNEILWDCSIAKQREELALRLMRRPVEIPPTPSIEWDPHWLFGAPSDGGTAGGAA